LPKTPILKRREYGYSLFASPPSLR